MSEHLEQQIVVDKLGSDSSTNEFGMDPQKVDAHVEQLAHLRARYGLVVVASGAIAVGRLMWQAANPTSTEAISDASLATIGSATAYQAWETAFAKRGIITGQVQVTHREIEDSKEGSMLHKTLYGNLQAGIVSIVNENDALSDEESAALSYGGDNDGLAAHLAVMLGARHLCLMTDVEGLLDVENNKSLVRQVDSQNVGWAASLAMETSLEAADPQLGAKVKKSRGGMKSKVIAAWKAAQEGIEVHIASAEQNLYAVTAQQVGTHFMPVKKEAPETSVLSQ